MTVTTGVWSQNKIRSALLRALGLKRYNQTLIVVPATCKLTQKEFILKGTRLHPRVSKTTEIRRILPLRIASKNRYQTKRKWVFLYTKESLGEKKNYRVKYEQKKLASHLCCWAFTHSKGEWFTMCSKTTPSTPQELNAGFIFPHCLHLKPWFLGWVIFQGFLASWAGTDSVSCDFLTFVCSLVPYILKQSWTQIDSVSFTFRAPPVGGLL